MFMADRWRGFEASAMAALSETPGGCMCRVYHYVMAVSAPLHQGNNARALLKMTNQEHYERIRAVSAAAHGQ